MTKVFIDLDQYKIADHVGEGPTGDIHLLKSKESDLTYCVKILKKSISKNDEKKESKKFLQEIESLSKLNYQSIVRFIGFSPIKYSNNNTSAIVSDFVSNISLHQILQQSKDGSNDQFNDTAKLIAIYGIAAGMSYLHSHNVVHCNLKTENIILDNDYYPFITDFALSKIIHEKLNKKTIDSTNKIHGTVVYLPPEFFTDYQYTKQSDVYAFSMIMYEILTGEKPFGSYDFTKIVKKVSQNHRPKFNSKISKSFQNLIEKCWDQDPNNRPTFDQIVDQLKNDASFITESVDKSKYSSYIEKLTDSNSKSGIEKESGVKARKAKSEPLHDKEKKVKAKKTKSDNLNEINKKSDKKKKSKSDKDNDLKEGQNEADIEKDDKNGKDKDKEKVKEAKKESLSDKEGLKEKNDNLDDINTKSGKKKKVKSDKKDKLQEDKNGKTDIEEKKVKVKKAKSETLNDPENSKQKKAKVKKAKSENLDEVKAKSGKKKKSKSDKDDDEEHKIKSGKTKSVENKELQSKREQMNEEEIDDEYDEEKAREIMELVNESRKELNGILSGKKPKNYKENDPEAQRLFDEQTKKLEEEMAKKQKEEEEENQLTTLDDIEDEERKQALIKNMESHCNIDCAKNEIQYLIHKEKNDKKMMFESAKNIYYDAAAGYKLRQNEIFIRSKEKALDYLEALVNDDADMEIISSYGMFLYYSKPTDPPDYEKIGKHLRNAGVNGRYCDCLELYLELVEQGNIVINDCEDVGLLYERLSDYDVKRDMSKEATKHLTAAVKCYMKGMKLKQPGSMFRYANLIQEGKIEGKKNQDLHLYIKGANLNHPGSMYKYGLWLEKSQNRSDVNKAIELFRKAADKRYPDAMFKYAQILEKTCMIKSDRLKAIDLYQRAADMDHPDSMHRYAQLLEEGIHIEASKSRALEYYKKAANCDVLKYILEYAEIVKNGRLGFVNFIEASDYYFYAYDLSKNEAYSHYSKALYLNDEQNSLADKKESVAFYKQAADSGYVNAMFDYATILLVGTLTNMNKVEAAKYFKMAADNGHSEAMYNYGTMLKNGDGIPANKAEADQYLYMAASHK